MKIVIKTTKKLFLKLLLFGIFLVVLVGVIGYARGYRFNLAQGKITSTGILSVSSFPKPASIYINGELSGATDSNITLPYGNYEVEIKKEGYSSWKRNVSLKGELVMSLDAKLFLKNPALTPLTSIGVTKAVPVGNTDKLIAISKSDDVEKDGIYVYEPSSQPVNLFSSLSLILSANLVPEEYDLESAEFEFNPNFSQTIVTFFKKSTDQNTLNNANSDLNTNVNGSVSYLLNMSSENTKVYDLLDSKESILSKWNTDKLKENEKIIGALPKKIQQIATESMMIISVSPDDRKILYMTMSDNTLPLVIDPALIASNQAEESRELKTGKVYVYDKREDKNFEVKLSGLPELPKRITAKKDASLSPTPLGNTQNNLNDYNPNDISIFISQMRDILTWFPTSDYFLVKEDAQISALSYDGLHREVVYAGPFDNRYFSILPDGDVLVLINLNPQSNTQGDIYSVSLW